ncbi:MAG TPA: ribosome maturation factor RimM [Pyrinomonadaceae bacterium]|nr:ribosome maturation factor RimM [Pyrinomonadaceae bacterium]
MSESKGGAHDDPANEELVAVALVVRTRGLRGEVVAELLTDFPERFRELERLIAVDARGRRETLKLEEHWFQKGRVVLKFAGFDSIEEAQALIGRELAVPEAERMPLSEDEFYDWELQGCEVLTIEDERLGRVVKMMKTGGVEMLVVESESGRDYLIPLAEEICVEIDVERKRIRVDAPEGMLEL